MIHNLDSNLVIDSYPFFGSNIRRIFNNASITSSKNVFLNKTRANFNAFLGILFIKIMKRRMLNKMVTSFNQSQESYQAIRNFYTESQYILDLFTNVAVLIKPKGKLFSSVLHKTLYKAMKEVRKYNLKAKGQIQQMDETHFIPGDLFKRITEEEAWNSRCRKYAILA